MLTKRERNLIFEIVVENGLEVGSCELLDPSHYLVLRSHTHQATIQHEATSSHFTFWRSDQGQGYVSQSDVGGADWSARPATSWDELMGYIADWAREVAYETETPDLWLEMQQMQEVMAAAQSADASNAPFTPDEQDEIAYTLDEIRHFVLESFDLTAEQFDAVDQRLDDVEEASTRLGRKDWATILIGAMVSTGMTDAVPPGVIQTVLTTLLHGIGHILGFGAPPPEIGP